MPILLLPSGPRATFRISTVTRALRDSGLRSDARTLGIPVGNLLQALTEIFLGYDNYSNFIKFRHLCLIPAYEASKKIVAQ
jgi:hypothetical protein